MKPNRKVVLLIIMTDIALQIFSQSDSDNRKFSPIPSKALLYSTLCPGLGQVYNKKYWKLPIIYGGGTALTYSLCYNQMKFKKFKKALFEGKDTAEIDGLIYTNIKGGKDFYRRYRDISLIGLAAIYILNIMDAMIDAHFYYFDISDDLSMNLRPAIFRNEQKIFIGLEIIFSY